MYPLPDVCSRAAAGATPETNHKIPMQNQKRKKKWHVMHWTFFIEPGSPKPHLGLSGHDSSVIYFVRTPHNQQHVRTYVPMHSPASQSQRLTLQAWSHDPSPSQFSMHPSLQRGASHAQNTFWPTEVKKSSGIVGAPRKTSSLKYMKRFDSPGMRCRLASIAGDENVGRCDLFENIMS